MSTPIILLQKQCVISNSQKIAVGSFGPCHVIKGYDPKTKYSFLAHIDDMTNVESISNLFRKLKELGVDSKNLTQVAIMGGWKETIESDKWGHKIITLLQKEGVTNIDQTYFQKKPTATHLQSGVSAAANHYFFGGVLDPAKEGQFEWFKNSWQKIERLQEEANEQSLKDAGVDLEKNEDSPKSTKYSDYKPTSNEYKRKATNY